MLFLHTAGTRWIRQQSEKRGANQRLPQTHRERETRHLRVYSDFFFFFFESDNLLFHPLSCIQSRAADTLETPTILWTPQGPTEGPRWSLLKVIILQRGSGGRYEEDISAFFFSRLCCWNMPKSWNIYDLNKPNEQIIYWWGVKLTGYFNVWKKYERNGATFWELCLFL